jgi:hypothetical protein
MPATPARVAVLPARFFASFVAAAAVTAAFTGIPTDLIPNDWFTRMTPVQGYAYPVWAAAALLSGLLAGLYWGVAAACTTTRSGALGGIGALASWLAVGCPVCNKVVVLALGASGAMTYFAPVQPWLGAASLTALVAAVVWRWRALVALQRA